MEMSAAVATSTVNNLRRDTVGMHVQEWVSNEQLTQ